LDECRLLPSAEANSEPITATPSVPPSWRVLSFTAEPTPAFRWQ
jgi:hypothetical protein